MARSALHALDRLELLGFDSLIFNGEDGGERAAAGRGNGLDDAGANAGANAPESAMGLDIAAVAPDGLPAGPASPGADIIGMQGVALIDPVFAAKGGSKPDSGSGGGGGKKGGGGDGGGGGDPALLKDYTSGGEASASFNVEVIFKGTWTQPLQQAFIDAADYLSTIITGDLADVFFRGKVIDDIRIDASLIEIDGAGGILGQAGPTAYRTADYLPATAIMEFDIADAEYFDGLGQFDDIVLHEMIHSIGFGTLWDLMGLLSGSIEAGTLGFTGANAMAAYAAEFGGSGYVPVETDGGPGTAGGHWDDTLFLNELMTGYIGAPGDTIDSISNNYISAMTVAALEDMGYETLWDPSDPADSAGILPDPINDALV